MVDFYDRGGNAVAYCEDGENIYTWDGRPIAFLKSEKIFNYSGKLIGRFENGWFRDRDGKCLLFTAQAQGGPVTPVKKVKPVKGVKRVKPVKPVTEVPPVKPVNSLSWSNKAFDALI